MCIRFALFGNFDPNLVIRDFDKDPGTDYRACKRQLIKSSMTYAILTESTTNPLLKSRGQ